MVNGALPVHSFAGSGIGFNSDKRGNEMKKMLSVSIAAIAIGMAAPAQAATLLFEFESVGEMDFRFLLDSDPTPTSVFDGSFTVQTFTAPDVAPNAFEIEFFDFFNGGGFDVIDGPSLFGPQIFNGSVANPSFSTGTFVLGAGDGSPAGFLEVSVPVPEPATWAMMLLGFFGVGAMMRHGQRVRSTKVSYS